MVQVFIARARRSKAAGRFPRGLLLSCVVAAGLPAQSPIAAAADETGGISGQLLDESGHAVNVKDAVVFLFDAQSGLPIVRATEKPLLLDPRANQVKGFPDFWHTMSDDRGKFGFQNVPAGRYRLVAQNWSGMEGVPGFTDKPSPVIVLHGVADDIAVKVGEVAQAHPRKLGGGTLKIVNDPEEEHAFLLISRNPRLGEGVLGPAAWGTKFMTGLIGVTQMEHSHVTIEGLPENKEIHVGLLNYDNNPGLGGDTYLVGKDDVVRLNIYATWSNGKYDPPRRLEPLTTYLETHDADAAQLLDLTGNVQQQYEEIWKRIYADPEQTLEIEGLGKVRVIDLLAADRYKSLRAAHRKRAKR